MCFLTKAQLSAKFELVSPMHESAAVTSILVSSSRRLECAVENQPEQQTASHQATPQPTNTMDVHTSVVRDPMQPFRDTSNLAGKLKAASVAHQQPHPHPGLCPPPCRPAHVQDPFPADTR
jgi:hypothetical protein